jgi:hypothetical protein
VFVADTGNNRHSSLPAFKFPPHHVELLCVELPSLGLYTAEINLESVAGKPLMLFIEKARFTIEVE